MKLGRDVSRHNKFDNWRNTHIYESDMATIWLLVTISETDPGLWDRLVGDGLNWAHYRASIQCKWEGVMVKGEGSA